MDGGLPEPVLASLAGALGATPRVLGLRPVGGGCINDGRRVDTDAGPFFLKRNRRRGLEGLFAAEADGLRRLRVPGAPRVPAVIASGEDPGADRAWLWLEWLEPAPPAPDADEGLGRGLAALHRVTAPRFGLEGPDVPRPGYLGAVPQDNRPADSWAELSRRRWAAVAERCGGALPAATRDRLAAVAARLEELLPTESPALVHGDLWAGNRHPGPGGRACLIDPAAHFGHREADLAMMRLFGGFGPRVFAAYAEAFPPAPGAAERVPLFQVWPLLVHVALFGGGYAASLDAALRPFA
jgi:fructosamine-3-kinase